MFFPAERRVKLCPMDRIVKKTATLVTLSVVTMMMLARGTARAQTLNCNFPLDFGTVVNCPGGGTLKIATETGSPTVTGCITSSPGGINRGSCTVSQIPSPPDFLIQQIQVSVTATSFNINSGANNMAVNNFNLQTDAGGVMATTTALVATIDIGATLNVGPSQPGGNYSGAVNVTAIFQ